MGKSDGKFSSRTQVISLWFLSSPKNSNNLQCIKVCAVSEWTFSSDFSGVSATYCCLLEYSTISDKKIWNYSAQASLLWNGKLNEKINFHAHTANDLISFHTHRHLHAINSIFHHNDGENPIDFHQHHHVHVPVEHARNGFKNLRSDRRVAASLLCEKWEENVNECNDSLIVFPKGKSPLRHEL